MTSRSRGVKVVTRRASAAWWRWLSRVRRSCSSAVAIACQQGLLLHRLQEEIDGPRLHGLGTQGDGPMAGEEDDGQAPRCGPQGVLHHQAVLPRKPHIQTRQAGPSGTWHPRNSRADAKVSTCSPSERMRRANAPRTPASSSTTKTVGAVPSIPLLLFASVSGFALPWSPHLCGTVHNGYQCSTLCLHRRTGPHMGSLVQGLGTSMSLGGRHLVSPGDSPVTCGAPPWSDRR